MIGEFCIGEYPVSDSFSPYASRPIYVTWTSPTSIEITWAEPATPTIEYEAE
jgi:hypothetical protein